MPPGRVGSGSDGADARLPGGGLQRGRVAEYVQRWGHVQLFSPFGQMTSPLGRAALRFDNPKHDLPKDADLITGRDYVSAYLEPLAMTGPLIESLKLETQVVQIGRTGLMKTDKDDRVSHPFRLLVARTERHGANRRGRHLLDCSGVYGNPPWMGGGESSDTGSPPCALEIAVPGRHCRRRSVKVCREVRARGWCRSFGRDSVVRLAELAEKQQDMWIVWLARGPLATVTRHRAIRSANAIGSPEKRTCSRRVARDTSSFTPPPK